VQRILTRRRALQFLTWSPAPLLALAQEAARPLAITHVTVIDGAGAAVRDQTVIVSGQRITMVGGAGRVAAPAGAQLIDGRGQFAIPGLWDMHAHLSYTKVSALAVLLANGVTRIRDMGGILSEIEG